MNIQDSLHELDPDDVIQPSLFIPHEWETYFHYNKIRVTFMSVSESCELKAKGALSATWNIHLQVAPITKLFSLKIVLLVWYNKCEFCIIMLIFFTTAERSIWVSFSLKIWLTYIYFSNNRWCCFLYGNSKNRIL